MSMFKLLGWAGFIAAVVHFWPSGPDPVEPGTRQTVAGRETSLSDDDSDVHDEANKGVSYQCYSRASKELGALIVAIKACDREDALLEHDSNALAILPAHGFRDGVAGVFKKHQLHVNQNSEVACNDRPVGSFAPTAGCYLSIYVSRKRSSGKYSDLAGWHAIWFRGVQDVEFRPMNNIAEYLTHEDASFLKKGGMLEVADRP